ncbi:hypothetical protein FRC19_003759 [Serendipita sp. 401]|nr:hypothetical protein FRC16_005026 [Serendipita sp. 398]KAG8823468.1 hypothetical protein FRC19_003759 [Serendipita sp. 401]KAG8867621.1 hypothetical protein FRC20_005313 [Serendipita sp. 405]
MASFTRYATIGVLPWLCLAPFQYGYAISQLNQIQKAMSCKSTELGAYGFPLCVPMEDAEFGLITSIFTIGGLISSLVANRITDPYGRRPAVQINAILVALGSAIAATASSVFALSVARFLIGLAAGLALCVAPSFLSEIAPPKVRDAVGVLNQLSVVFGILFTQFLGFAFAKPGSWRAIFVISFGLSTLQFLLGLRMIESPAWLAANNKKHEASIVAAKIWKSEDGTRIYEADDVEEALLRQREPLVNQDQPSATIPQCFRIAELRLPLIIVSLAMLAQQLSGINAVMYYSTDILSRAMPEAAPYVSLAVAVINVIMTFPPIFVIERYGKRKLLMYSVVGSIIAVVLLAIALNYKMNAASAVGTLLFVSCFAFGLGPIPFIIIPDVSPLYAVAALSSISLSINWATNFVIGLTFLPLRNILAGPDNSWPGNIFYLFAFLLTVSSVAFFRYF